MCFLMNKSKVFFLKIDSKEYQIILLINKMIMKLLPQNLNLHILKIQNIQKIVIFQKCVRMIKASLYYVNLQFVCITVLNEASKLYCFV